MNYYISDLHFGHGNVIKFDGRPFENTEEMEKELVKNWNETVGKEDVVYVIGDFCWDKGKEWIRILKELKGKKVLIRGNHDLKSMNEELKGMWEDVKDYKEITDGENKIILCHYPILFYKGSYDENVWMLHGHVHERTKEAEQCREMIKEIRKEKNEGGKDGERGTYWNRGQIVNVGCMMDWMEWKPRKLEEIKEAWKRGMK